MLLALTCWRRKTPIAVLKRLQELDVGQIRQQSFEEKYIRRLNASQPGTVLQRRDHSGHAQCLGATLAPPGEHQRMQPPHEAYVGASAKKREERAVVEPRRHRPVDLTLGEVDLGHEAEMQADRLVKLPTETLDSHRVVQRQVIDDMTQYLQRHLA